MKNTPRTLGVKHYCWKNLDRKNKFGYSWPSLNVTALE
jgi:hypothetical protein